MGEQVQVELSVCAVCMEDSTSGIKFCNMLPRSVKLSIAINEILELRTEAIIPADIRRQEKRMLCGTCTRILRTAYSYRHLLLSRVKDGSYIDQKRKAEAAVQATQRPLQPNSPETGEETPGPKPPVTSQVVEPHLPQVTDATAWKEERVVYKNLINRNFQDFDRCCNCYETVLEPVMGRRLSDVLCAKVIPGSGDGGGAGFRYLEVTVQGSLDIMFDVKKNSLLSNITLNESYCLCHRCISNLGVLFDSYLVFVDHAVKPSFLSSAFVQNETLNIFQQALHADISANPCSPQPGTGTGTDAQTSESGSKHDHAYSKAIVDGTTDDIHVLFQDPVARRKCFQCNMVLKSKKQWSYHVTLHENPTVVCPDCKVGFNKKHMMVRHRQEVHPAVYEQEQNNLPVEPALPTYENIFEEIPFVAETIDIEDSPSRPENEPSEEQITTPAVSVKRKRLRKAKAKTVELKESVKLTPSQIILEEFGPMPAMEMYQCPSCPDKFLTSTVLRAHVLVHNESNHSCPVCQAGFVTSGTLQAHLSTAHSAGTHETLVEIEIETNDKIKSDESDEKTGRQWKCVPCNLTFLHPTYVRLHLDHFHNSGISKYCPVCHQIVMGEADQSVHNYRLHKPKPTLKRDYNKGVFPCEYCGRVFTQKAMMNEHIRRNHEVSGFKYPCDKCSFVGLTRLQRTQHNGRCHPKYDPIICPEPGCGFPCKTRTHYISHSKLHKCEADRSIRPYACTYEGCTKRYYRQNAQQLHIRTHGQPRIICEECGKGFHQMGILKMHIENRHRFKAPGFTCDICGVGGYTHKNSLTSHLWKEHKIQRKNPVSKRRPRQAPSLCNECGMSFATPKALETHKNSVIHNKSVRKENKYPRKTYTCHCGVISSSLPRHRAHKRTHAIKRRTRSSGSQKPCPNCGQLFYRTHDLNIHVEKCDGTKRLRYRMRIREQASRKKYTVSKSGLFVCTEPDCGMEFTLVKYLRNHVNFAHNWDKKECPVCSRVLSSKAHLNRHWRSFHADVAQDDAPEPDGDTMELEDC